MIITENFFDKHVRNHHGLTIGGDEEKYGFVFSLSFNIRKTQFANMSQNTRLLINSMISRMHKVLASVPFISIIEFSVNVSVPNTDQRYTDINPGDFVDIIKRETDEGKAEQFLLTIAIPFVNKSYNTEHRTIRKHITNVLLMWKQLCNCYAIPFINLTPLFFVWHQKGDKNESSLCLEKHLNKTPYALDVICDALNGNFEVIDDKTYAVDDLTITERLESFAEKTNNRNSQYDYIIKDYTNKSFSDDDRYLKFYLKIRPKENKFNTMRGIITFIKNFIGNECSFADRLALLKRFDDIEGGLEFNILTLSMPSGDNEYNSVYQEDYVDVMGKKLRLFFGFEWGKYVYSNVIPRIDNER